MKRLIIFDWDDVITLGSRQGYYACYHQALSGVGVHLDPLDEEKRIVAKWGTTHVEELKELLQEHPELVERASAIYEKALFGETFVNELRVLDGTVEALHALAKMATLCVATGSHPEIILRRSMPKFHLPNVFAEILSSYAVRPEQQKPDRYMVNYFMKEYGASTDETVVVGDGESDVFMARNAGVTPIVVLTGHLTRESATRLGVEHIIDDVTKLPALLFLLR